MLLFGEIRNITFSYERILKKNQSLAVQAGYLAFPNLIDDTIASLILITGRSRQGMNLAFDYRYYPGLRNRRPIPDGLYFGGYLSYYGFIFDNDLDNMKSDNDQHGQISGHLNDLNFGFNLGYQFVFWKRLTIDLLMFGPSLRYTQGELKIQGDLEQEEIDAIDQELIDKLLDRFPFIGEIFSEESLVFTGSRTKFGTGFRYSIQFGYHF